MARPPTAVLVTLLLFASALLAPTALALPQPGDLPATLTVPRPMAGDAGTYSRSVVTYEDGVVATIDGPQRQESFRFESPRDHYDADGVPHRVHDVHSWMPEESIYEADQHYFIDASDGGLVAVRHLETGPDYYTERTYFPGGWLPRCGMTNHLQGQQVDLAGTPVAIFHQPCRLPLTSYGPGDAQASFVPVRLDTFGDTQAVAFQQVATDVVVMAWFTETIPFPVRLLTQLGGPEGSRFAVLDLVDFRRGDAPSATPGEAPQSRALAPVRLAGHDDAGPDETGVTHPFPWSTAWAAASQDAKVRGFLDGHPGAKVRASVYNEQLTTSTTGPVLETRHADAWFFFLDDGRAAHKFSISSVREATDLVLPGVGPVSGPSDAALTVEDLGPVASEFDAFGSARPLPDVRSATAWWSAYATPEFRSLGANGWMFFQACTCDGGAVMSTAGGRLKQTITDDSFHWEASFLHVSQEGKAIVLVENIVQAEYGLPLGLAPPLPGAIAAPLARILRDALDDQPHLAAITEVPGPVATPIAGPPGKPSDATRLVAVADDPVPQATSPEVSATHLSLVAAGAGGVVGLAVLGKVLLGGLFSRLRRDRALEQPVRRLLMETIEGNPGIHLSALAAATGKGVGTVRHHIGKLVEADLVHARDSGGYLCYFPRRSQAAEHAAASSLKAEGARRVLAGLQARPLGIRPLAGRVGLAPSTVEHHLQRLMAAGLVARDGTAYLATERGRAAAAL